MIDIGISEKNRTEIAKRLNLLLSNEYVLYTKTLKYHWNVEGKHFDAFHKFFKDLYEQLFPIVDDVAERARALGVKSFGTLNEFSQHTTLEEKPGLNPDELGMVSILLADHETIIKQLRIDLDVALELDDAGTSNFFTDLMEKHEKMAWMLRSHLVK